MSTTYRPATPDLSWYAAFAVLAGVVLALAIAVLQGGSDSVSTTIPPGVAHVERPSHVCFATPHHPNLDLARSGCTK
jgi:hypothetical protein